LLGTSAKSPLKDEAKEISRLEKNAMKKLLEYEGAQKKEVDLLLEKFASTYAEYYKSHEKRKETLAFDINFWTGASNTYPSWAPYSEYNSVGFISWLNEDEARFCKAHDCAYEYAKVLASSQFRPIFTSPLLYIYGALRELEKIGYLPDANDDWLASLVETSLKYDNACSSLHRRAHVSHRSKNYDIFEIAFGFAQLNQDISSLARRAATELNRDSALLNARPLKEQTSAASMALLAYLMDVCHKDLKKEKKAMQNFRDAVKDYSDQFNISEYTAKSSKRAGHIQKFFSSALPKQGYSNSGKGSRAAIGAEVEKAIGALGMGAGAKILAFHAKKFADRNILHSFYKLGSKIHLTPQIFCAPAVLQSALDYLDLQIRGAKSAVPHDMQALLGFQAAKASFAKLSDTLHSKISEFCWHMQEMFGKEEAEGLLYPQENFTLHCMDKHPFDIVPPAEQLKSHRTINISFQRKESLNASGITFTCRDNYRQLTIISLPDARKIDFPASFMRRYDFYSHLVGPKVVTDDYDLLCPFESGKLEEKFIFARQNREPNAYIAQKLQKGTYNPHVAAAYLASSDFLRSCVLVKISGERPDAILRIINGGEDPQQMQKEGKDPKSLQDMLKILPNGKYAFASSKKLEQIIFRRPAEILELGGGFTDKKIEEIIMSPEAFEMQNFMMSVPLNNRLRRVAEEKFPVLNKLCEKKLAELDRLDMQEKTKAMHKKGIRQTGAKDGKKGGAGKFLSFLG